MSLLWSKICIQIDVTYINHLTCTYLLQQSCRIEDQRPPHHQHRVWKNWEFDPSFIYTKMGCKGRTSVSTGLPIKSIMYHLCCTYIQLDIAARCQLDTKGEESVPAHKTRGYVQYTCSAETCTQGDTHWEQHQHLKLLKASGDGERARSHAWAQLKGAKEISQPSSSLYFIDWLYVTAGWKNGQVFSRIRLGCVHKHRRWRTQHSACPNQTWVSMFRTCLSPQSRFSVNGAQEVDEPPVNLNQLRSEAGSFIKGSSAWMFKAPSCERGLEIKAQSTFPCSLCVFCGRSSASDLWHSRWLVIFS